ncbi:hypothetical protein [Methylobacterium sp. B4]|uniref:hypothetical protein n=1 Tax=Methylobacterium sp. B4 TaxID=1938755 RepID=UPI000D760424|nr:hypothetical protein [Methylobacterium sp. B4]PXW62080.1 hypothetical protein BY998_10767 [Methylobacterium sp. B4]
MRVLGFAALIGLLAGAAPALAQGFDRIGGVAVDMRPLQAYARGPQAEALRADLTEALRRSFGDRMVRGAPTLVVRVSGLTLNPYAGGEGVGRGGSFGGGGSTDYLDGEALLVGRGGEILARHPQLSALPASSGGAWYDPASERRRLAALAEHYAQWLRRMLPAQ